MKKTNFITRIDSGLKRGEPFEFYFDGEPITAYSGETVAAALFAAGKRGLGATNKNCKPRGYYCGMGVCWGCLVIVDGRPNIRACIKEAQPGMQVQTQCGLEKVECDG